jgi:hypothetical protein
MYKIIYSQYTSELEKNINYYLQEGWTLVGSPFVSTMNISGIAYNTFYQAIVRG